VVYDPFKFLQRDGFTGTPRLRFPGDAPVVTPRTFPVSRARDGGIKIAGQTLPVSPAAPQTPVAQIGQPVYQPGLYGDAFTFPVVFAGAGASGIALPRPKNKRVLLLIQNQLAANNIFYCFDRIADNVSCILIGAGGNRLFDSVVPQGNLYIFALGAGSVVIEYMNIDISTAQGSPT